MRKSQSWIAVIILLVTALSSVRSAAPGSSRRPLGVEQRQAGSETITLNTTPNVPTKFAFGASDGYVDAIVRLTLGAQCRVSITRNPTPPGQIESRCVRTLLEGIKPVLELSNPHDPNPSPPQAFIYEVEIVGTCSDSALPATMEIITFSNTADKFSSRLIHYVPPSKETPQDCEDVTSDLALPNDPTNIDPRIEGTQDRFSEFFLVNILPSARPTGLRVNERFDDLRKRTQAVYLDLVPTLDAAQQVFNMGLSFLEMKDVDNARAEFRLALMLLDMFASRVKTLRDSKVITPGQAAPLIARERRLAFLIKQFAGLNNIDL